MSVKYAVSESRLVLAYTKWHNVCSSAIGFACLDGGCADVSLLELGEVMLTVSWASCEASQAPSSIGLHHDAVGLTSMTFGALSHLFLCGPWS